MSDWISVNKRLPEDGQAIRGRSWLGEWEETWDEDEPIGRMTHWKESVVKYDITEHKWFDCAIDNVELEPDRYLVLRFKDDMNSTILSYEDAMAIAKYFDILDIEAALIHKLGNMGHE